MAMTSTSDKVLQETGCHGKIMKTVAENTTAAVPSTSSSSPTSPSMPQFSFPACKHPFCEFEENDILLYSLFPEIFFLGRGLLQKGSVSTTAVRHLMLQYDNRAAKHLPLVFLLFNQMQRHAASQAVAATVKTNPEAFREFSKWVSDKDFITKLHEAQLNPCSDQSKQLLQLILPHIGLVDKNIPYSVSQRKSSMGHLYAMMYYLGMPTIYFTFSPDDTYSVLNIRLSNPQANNCTFPANESGIIDALKRGDAQFHDMTITAAGLRTLLASGPGAVAAGEMFRLLVQSVFTNILGMPPCQEAKRTVPLPLRPHGVFGTITAAFGVTEEQARGSPHMHIVTI